MVYLEAVGPMPKQGVTSVFSFGRSTGVVEGVVAALGLSLTRTKPQVWKRQAGLLNRGKDASRGRALDLYPHAAQWLARVRDTGRAEAILIGRFGCGDASQRQLSGGSE